MAAAAEQVEADLPVAGRIKLVCERIAQSARSAGREPAEISLVAVSKAQPEDRVLAALDAGQRVFGENYVQPAMARWPRLRERFPGIELHMIGAIQTNKAKEVVLTFDVVQTLDRPKLARALAREMDRQARRLPCFVQVNTGEEAQKAGVLPDVADQFIAASRGEFGLDVVGLMAIPPADDEPALHFALLDEIGKRNGLPKLSMGMSEDFEIAVACGATHVRIGSALFGPRPPRHNGAERA
jgi:pyridoxal phosphate enzyme (YggS family)